MERSADVCRVGELVRNDRGAIEELIALGIGPRYLHWSLAETAADLGIGLDQMLGRLSRFLPGELKVANR